MSQPLTIEHRSIAGLIPYAKNARTHSKKQIRQIADSIQRFGFTNPILVGRQGEVIAGHGRLAAAMLLGMTEVPTVRLAHLSDAERRAYILADNKLALNAGWDQELLAIELQGLVDLDFEIELTGFGIVETDLILDGAAAADPNRREAAEDRMPPPGDHPVCRLGELWQLGRHRLLCGDTQVEASFATLLGDEQVDLVFTDPPYNVPIGRNVCGLGSVQHREFAFASGEMSETQFITFLEATLGNMARRMRDGAIAFVCMDWRHAGELLTAGRSVFTEIKNLVVWNKSNAGMGTFYRSKHELIFVFKQGEAPHTNSFGLGDTGRYRTNVWDYPGISSLGADRDAELAMHPTVKPGGAVADALRDCSKRGDIILDGFGGSGTTLIAAQKVGRCARLIEYDPLYCDTIIRRWETTGKRATLASSGQSFEDVAAERGPAQGGRSMNDSDDPALPAYRVGYGKPPVKNRFPRGASGNPRGRPKRNEVRLPETNALDVAGQPLAQAIQTEMYRVTTVIEGGKKVRMTNAEVILKGIILSAKKGSRPAQRYLLDRIDALQQADRELRCTSFEQLLKHKTDAQQLIEAARRAGRAEPEILPHPDDIVIDIHTPEIRVLGPWTPEQLAHAHARQARLARLMKDLEKLELLIEQEQEEDLKATMWESAVELQIEIQSINLALPRRLRLL